MSDTVQQLRQLHQQADGMLLSDDRHDILMTPPELELWGLLRKALDRLNTT